MELSQPLLHIRQMIWPALARSTHTIAAQIHSLTRRLVQLPRRSQLRLAVGTLFIIVGILGIYRLWPQPGVASMGSYDPFSSRQEYEKFYASHPILLQKSPLDAPFNVTMTISRDKTISYHISLFAPAIRPNNDASVAHSIETLRANQVAARRWLQKYGENPTTAFVVWSPDPARYDPKPSVTSIPLPQITSRGHD